MTEVKYGIKYCSIKDVQSNFEQNLGDMLLSGDSMEIITDSVNAILVSEEVWNGMTEMLNSVSFLCIRESARTGINEHINNTNKL